MNKGDTEDNQERWKIMEEVPLFDYIFEVLFVIQFHSFIQLFNYYNVFWIEVKFSELLWNIQFKDKF